MQNAQKGHSGTSFFLAMRQLAWWYQYDII